MAHRELSVHAGVIEIQAIFCEFEIHACWQAGGGSQHLLAEWQGVAKSRYQNGGATPDDN